MRVHVLWEVRHVLGHVRLVVPLVILERHLEI